MTVPAFSTVTWFRVGADAPEEARRFYGAMFGWRFTAGPDEDGYDLMADPGAAHLGRGLAPGADPPGNGAMFLVMVEDVDATCARTERSGGRVAVPAVTGVDGLRFAYLEDPTGNRFGVFTPPVS